MFENYQSFSKPLFSIWILNVPQELFDNIFKIKLFSVWVILVTEKSSFNSFWIWGPSNIPSFNLASDNWRNWNAIYSKHCRSLYICLLLFWSNLKTEFGARKSMKIRCWPTYWCSNSFVLKLCYELFSNMTNLT